MKTDKKDYLLCSFVFFVALMANEELVAENNLGEFPLCEPSAALLIDCPDDRDARCLLVADNEQGRDLYLFAISGDKLSPNVNPTFDLKLPGEEEIGDIEALANSGGEILVFGSHSRNVACDIKKKRKKFGKIDLAGSKTTIVGNLKSKSVTCSSLYTGKAKDASILAACKQIDTADQNATAIDNSRKKKQISELEAKERCNFNSAFNAEGAVAFKGETDNELWIGLRAPLLQTHPEQPKKKNLAILLQLENSDSFTFDRVAFVDLDERGIRDMYADGDFIWIIAGPPEDHSEPFQLRRIPKSALNHSEIIESELVSNNLPNSSEGLAVSGKTVYVVIDGDAGKGTSSCLESAKYTILSLD